jgi:hypothetical protein
VDDLLDQLERVLRGETQPDEGNIGPFPSSHRSDRADFDLTRDHVVPEPCDDLGEQFEPVATLVRDQDTQMPNLVLDHTRGDSRERRSTDPDSSPGPGLALTGSTVRGPRPRPGSSHPSPATVHVKRSVLGSLRVVPLPRRVLCVVAGHYHAVRYPRLEARRRLTRDVLPLRVGWNRPGKSGFGRNGVALRRLRRKRGAQARVRASTQGGTP